MPSSPNSAIASGSDRAVGSLRLAPEGSHCIGRFRAMASPCEVLVGTTDLREARSIVEAVARCAWRIEDKFSRYRKGNIVHAINTSAGHPVTVDEETANLLDFAATVHALSDGRFDITSGVLRRAWRFDGRASLPRQADIEALLPLVGWNKVTWQRPVLTLLPEMQIDFGGIGKEYAVDEAAGVARGLFAGSCLVNFGGDLAISRPREEDCGWRVGVESARVADGAAVALLELRHGALATSGDTYRFVLQDGRRYTHILDPHTGWPVVHAPRSVTVCAPTCTQAGVLTTLALLRGAEAEQFLNGIQARYWVQRG
jgi:thiamine biosynthesis lipoprotein